MKPKDAKAILDGIISEICADPSLFVEHPGKDFTRNRKLPLSTMLRIMISMGGASIKKEIYKYNPSILVTSSAFVQQRDKILPDIFGFILRLFTDKIVPNNNYRGYRLLAFDGSSITLSTNPYSPTFVDNNPLYEGGYSSYHLNAFYDLCNKIFVDAVVEPQSMFNENGAAIKMVDRSHIDKAIIMADRGYPGVNLFEHINRKPGLEYIIRTKNDWITEVKELPLSELDTDVSFELRTTQRNEDKILFRQRKAKWIPGPSKFGKEKKDVLWDFESPFRMTLRVVRFKLGDTGNNREDFKTIVTSLDRNEFPLEEIKKLYHFRWGIETSFRELKYDVSLSHIHTKKDSAAMQEILASLIMYNYCMCIAMDVVVKQKAENEYEYQINFSFAFFVCKDHYRCRDPDPPDIVPQIAKETLPIRPGRSDRRKSIQAKPFIPFIYRVS